MKEVRISLPAWECHDTAELVDALTQMLQGEEAFVDARFTVASQQMGFRCEDCGWVLASDTEPVGLRCPKCGSIRVEVIDDGEVDVSLIPA